MKKKYQSETSIRDKIQLLFEDRKLSDLLRISRLERNKTFVKNLTEIQYQIYLLDAYLESGWDLDADELAARWEGIHAAIEKAGYEKEQIPGMLKEIRRYEKIELNCRQNKWPTRISFKEFYTTKSCDVRLMRNLIYDAFPDLKNTWKKKAWLAYDRITEVFDDIADLNEDLPTCNGNRLLISILRKGSEFSRRAYVDYLRKVTKEAKDYFESHPTEGDNPTLMHWTAIRSKETIQLLDKTFTEWDPEVYQNAHLLEYMS